MILSLPLKFLENCNKFHEFLLKITTPFGNRAGELTFRHHCLKFYNVKICMYFLCIFNVKILRNIKTCAKIPYFSNFGSNLEIVSFNIKSLQASDFFSGLVRTNDVLQQVGGPLEQKKHAVTTASDVRYYQRATKL